MISAGVALASLLALLGGLAYERRHHGSWEEVAKTVLVMVSLLYSVGHVAFTSKR